MAAVGGGGGPPPPPPGDQLGKAIGPTLGNPVRAGGVNDACARILGKLHSLFCGIVRQAKDRDIGSVERVAPSALVLALGLVQDHQFEFAAPLQPARGSRDPVVPAAPSMNRRIRQPSALGGSEVARPAPAARPADRGRPTPIRLPHRAVRTASRRELCECIAVVPRGEAQRGPASPTSR